MGIDMELQKDIPHEYVSSTLSTLVTNFIYKREDNSTV